MSGSNVTLAEMRKSIRTYMMVFGTLMFLTVVTVGLSYLHLPRGIAIFLGLAVATVKASLVALYFMHLNHEKALIYLTLLITAVCFLFCILIAFY